MAADASAEDEARAWLEAVLQEPFGEGVTLAAALCNGVRLCRLANIVRPGSIPKFSPDPKMAVKARENITLFIGALKAFGMRDFEVFSTLDLAEGEKQNMKSVVIALHALGRLCQGGEFAALGLPKLGAKVLEKNASGGDGWRPPPPARRPSPPPRHAATRARRRASLQSGSCRRPLPQCPCSTWARPPWPSLQPPPC
jgi:hypothetical protein